MSFSLNANNTFETLAFQDSKREVVFQDLSPVTLRNVYVSHSGLCLQGFQPVKISFFNNISTSRTKSLLWYTRLKKLIEKKLKGESNATFIHHIWSNGYHHWVCECLLKATYLDPNNTLLYLPEDYPDFAFESLTLLGFNHIRRIPRKTGVKCKKAVLIPNPTSGHFQRKDLDRIKCLFLGRFNGINQNKNRKIFISRSKAALRKIQNESELIPLLKKYEYELIHSEDLSFEDQVKIFSGCQALISIHGAGLTNCIFMPEGGFVFEIYRKMDHNKDVMNLCYYRMTRALSLNYVVQFADVVNTYENVTPDRQDLIIDVTEFEKNILLIENAIKC